MKRRPIVFVLLCMCLLSSCRVYGTGIPHEKWIRIEELAHQKRYEENVRKLCCFKGVSTHTALPLLVPL